MASPGRNRLASIIFDSIMQKNWQAVWDGANAYFSARIGPRYEYAGHSDARHPLVHIGGNERRLYSNGAR